MGDAKSMQIYREDLQDMHQNILDIKEETDGKSLPKLAALVFQELGINQWEEREIQIVEHKLREITLNNTCRGNIFLLFQI